MTTIAEIVDLVGEAEGACAYFVHKAHYSSLDAKTAADYSLAAKNCAAVVSTLSHALPNLARVVS